MLKTKKKFQTFSSKSGHGRLKEVFAYNKAPNVVIRFGFYFGFLENWLLSGGSCLPEVVATGGLTVY